MNKHTQKQNTFLPVSISLVSLVLDCFLRQHSLCNKDGSLTKNCINIQFSQSGKISTFYEKYPQTTLLNKNIANHTAPHTSWHLSVKEVLPLGGYACENYVAASEINYTMGNGALWVLIPLTHLIIYTDLD